MLRRTKDKCLLELTALGKRDTVVNCELSPVQESLYKHILSLPDFDNVRYHRNLCPCGSNLKRSECCREYIAPLLRDGSKEVDPRAVVWYNVTLISFFPSNPAL